MSGRTWINSVSLLLNWRQILPVSNAPNNCIISDSKFCLGNRISWLPIVRQFRHVEDYFLVMSLTLLCGCFNVIPLKWEHRTVVNLFSFYLTMRDTNYKDIARHFLLINFFNHHPISFALRILSNCAHILLENVKFCRQNAAPESSELYMIEILPNFCRKNSNICIAWCVL